MTLVGSTPEPADPRSPCADPAAFRRGGLRATCLWAALLLLASVHPASAVTFDVWYGQSQSFGQLGNPQRWVNVLGSLTDGASVTGLTYTLNGGPSRFLDLGPDSRRLLEEDDWNIDIDIAELQDGANTIVLTAVEPGDSTQQVISLDYTQGNVWPADFDAEWSLASEIADVAQVVDGLWSIVPGGLRPDVMGYDRIVAIGDVAWTDFEVTVPITIHDYDPNGFMFPSVAPGLGLTHRWRGHTELNPGEQPLAYWLPIGASFWYDFDEPKVFLAGADGLYVEDAPRTLTFDVTYIWKLRGETTGDGTTLYSGKIWPEGDPEPPGWDLQGVDGPGDLASGSLLLIAHHMDATFGDVEVVSLYDDMAPAIISALDVQPGQLSAVIEFVTNKPTTATVDYGTTAAYGSSVSETGPTTFHRIELTGLQAETTYHFQITADDGFSHLTTTPDDTFTIGSEFVSDDFSGASLDTNLWTFIDPRSDSTAVLNGTQLEIATPGTDTHGVWTNGNFLPRVAQAISDGDFEIEAKFDSDLVAEGQEQGILIEEDPDNVIRIDFHRTGGQDKIFVATIFGGSAQIRLNQDFALAVPQYLRVSRAGDQFTVSYSFDGTSFTPAVTFSQPMTVNQASVYAGNSDTAGHTAIVDYFFNTASPISPEDGLVPITTSVVGMGSIARTPDQPEYMLGEMVQLEAIPANGNWVFDRWEGDLTGSTNPQVLTVGAMNAVTAVFEALPDTLPPVISNIQSSVTDESATVTWTTDEPATSELHVGTAPGSYTLPPVTDGALVTSHSLQITGLSADTQHYFQVASEDAALNRAVSPEQTFHTAVEGFGEFVSDDFDDPTLDPALWTFVDPRADSSALVNGTQLEITASDADFHGVWTNGNFAPRVAQPVGDVDFEVEVKFESDVALEGHEQGILIEQGPNDVIRFDVHRTGGQTYLFAASIFGGGFQIHLNQALALPVPHYLRIGRVGDQFTVSYSLDGVSFVPADTFVQPMTVSQISVYAGNDGSTAHTAIVDYFFNTASPISPEDGQVPIDVSIVGMGSVVRTPDQPFYEIGEMVQLEAIPADGSWLFDRWEGDLTGSTNPETLTVAASNSVTAHFVPVPDPDPPVISGLQVSVRDDSATVSWTTDEPATSQLDVGTSPGVYTLPPVTDPSLVTAHSLEITGLTADTDYYFEVTSEDASMNAASSGDQTFRTAPAGFGLFLSDDFDDATLDQSLWNFIDPRSDSTAILNGSQLEIQTPGTDFHGVWTNGNFLPRVAQAVDDIDLEVEVKFESGVPLDGQEQGILFEESPGEVVRVDFHRDGSQVKLFAASIFGTTFQIHTNQNFSLPIPSYLRVGRVGNQFTVSTSSDGTTFTPRVTFDQPMTLNQISVYAGNAGASGHTAVIDYFFNTASPIVPEDPVTAPVDVSVVGMGSVTRSPDQPAYPIGSMVQLEAIPADPTWVFDRWEGDLTGSTNPDTLTVAASNAVTAVFVQPDTTPPTISNQAVTVTDVSAVISWTTDEPATTELQVGTSAGVYDLGTYSDPALVTSHSMGILGLQADTQYHYNIISVDASGNPRASGDGVFQTSPYQPGDFLSDDFEGPDLYAFWTFIDPLADATAAVTGGQLEIQTPGTSIHDVSPAGNFLPRVAQAVADEDFEVEADFDSDVASEGESQGILVEEDPDNVIQVDLNRSGGQTNLSVASRFAGGVVVHFDQPVALTPPMTVRVGRLGDRFFVSTSPDGTTFTPAVEFDQVMTVNQISAYSGNTDVNGHTTLIGSFRNTAQPVPEPGVGVLLMVGGSGLGWVGRRRWRIRGRP